MHGIHDLGGMHGFGRVEAEPNEPVFHAAWEKRVVGMVCPSDALDARVAALAARPPGHDHPRR